MKRSRAEGERASEMWQKIFIAVIGSLIDIVILWVFMNVKLVCVCMCFMENSSKNHFTSHSICNNTRYTHTVYCIRMHTYHNVQLSGYHNIVSLTCQWSCYERKQWTIVSFYKQMGNDSHVLIPNRAAKTIELNNSHRKNDFAISWSRIIIVITSSWCFIIWIGFYVSVSFVRSLFFCHYVIITIEFWPRSDDPLTICSTPIALFPCCTIYAVIKLFF